MSQHVFLARLQLDFQIDPSIQDVVPPPRRCPGTLQNPTYGGFGGAWGKDQNTNSITEGMVFSHIIPKPLVPRLYMIIYHAERFWRCDQAAELVLIKLQSLARSWFVERVSVLQVFPFQAIPTFPGGNPPPKAVLQSEGSLLGKFCGSCKALFHDNPSNTV